MYNSISNVFFSFSFFPKRDRKGFFLRFKVRSGHSVDPFVTYTLSIIVPIDAIIPRVPKLI